MNVFESKLINIQDIAKCHIRAFPSSVSSKLGMPFCKKMIEWFVYNERGVLFHIEDEAGNVVGYVSMMIKTAPNQQGSFTTISQYALKQVVLALLFKPWLFFHPLFKNNRKNIRRIVLSKFHLSKKRITENNRRLGKSKETNENFNPSIGIVGIGVISQCQGKGYGTALIQQCIAYSRIAGFNSLSLSVHKDNTQAIKAYTRNGFRITSHKIDGDICMTFTIK